MNNINSATKLRIWAQISAENPKVLRNRLENRDFFEDIMATVLHPPEVDDTQKEALAERVIKILRNTFIFYSVPDWLNPYFNSKSSTTDKFLKACRKGDYSYIKSKQWDFEALVAARTEMGGTPLHEFFSNPNPDDSILSYMSEHSLIGDWLLFRDLEGDLPLDRCTHLSNEIKNEFLNFFNEDSVEFLKYLCLLKKPDLALAHLHLLSPEGFIALLKFCVEANPNVIDSLLNGYAKKHPNQPLSVLIYHVDPSLLSKAPKPRNPHAICDEFAPELWNIEPLTSWPFFSSNLPSTLIHHRLLNDVPSSPISNPFFELFFKPENASTPLWELLINHFSGLLYLFENNPSQKNFDPRLKIILSQIIQSADFPIVFLLRRPVAELAKLLPHLWRFKLEFGLLIFEKCKNELPDLDLVEQTLKAVDFNNVDVPRFTIFLHETLRRFAPQIDLQSFYQKEDLRRDLFIYLTRNLSGLLQQVMNLPASEMKRYFLLQLSSKGFFQEQDLLMFLPQETDSEFIAAIIRNVFPSKKMPFPTRLLYNTNFILWDALFKHFERNDSHSLIASAINLYFVDDESLFKEVHGYIKRLQLPQEKESELWREVVVYLFVNMDRGDDDEVVRSFKILTTLIDVPIPLATKTQASWPLAVLTFYFERCGDGTLHQAPYADNSEEALYFSQHALPVERVQEMMYAITPMEFHVQVHQGYFQIDCQGVSLFRGYIHKRIHEAFLAKVAKRALLDSIKTTFNLPNHFHRVFEAAWFDEMQLSTAVKLDEVNAKAYLYTLDLESGLVVIRTREAGVDFKTTEEFRTHFEEQDRKIALQRGQLSEEHKGQFTLNNGGVYELIDGTKIRGIKNVILQLSLHAATRERLQKYHADGTAAPYFNTLSQALDANLPCAVIANGTFALYRLGDTLRAIPCGAIEEGKINLSRYREVQRDLKLSQVGANKIAEAAMILSPNDICPIDYTILTKHLEEMPESLLQGIKLEKAQALLNIANLIQILNDKKKAIGWEDRQKYAKEYFDLKAFLSHALHELKQTGNAEGLTTLTLECAKFGSHCGTKLSEVAQQGWMLAFKHYTTWGHENIVITAWKNAMAEFILLLSQLSNVTGNLQQQGHLIAYIRDSLVALGWKVPPHDAFSSYQNTFGKDRFARGNEEFTQPVIATLAQGMLPSLLLEKIEGLYREQNYDALAFLQQKIQEIAEKVLEEGSGFSLELQQHFALAKKERSERIHLAKARLQAIQEKNSGVSAPYRALIQEYDDFQSQLVILNQEIRKISEGCLRIEKDIAFQQRRKSETTENHPPKQGLKRYFSADLIREVDDEDQMLIASLKKNQEESHKRLQTALQRKTFLEQLIAQYKKANPFLETYEEMQQEIKKATQDYDDACFNRSQLNIVLEEALHEKGWVSLDETTQLTYITLSGLTEILFHEGLFFKA